MQQKKRRKRRYAVAVSGVFIALAVLGAGAVVYLCFIATSAVLDNTSQKQRFEDIIRPVVMFNPAPFEKASDIEPKNLLQYSMWSTLMNAGRDTYQFGDNGELVVPASDLDVAAAKLFGPQVELQHQSFGEVDMFYFYDEENSVYNAPVSVQLNVYKPSVIDILRKDGLYELNVGYIPTGISWQTDFSGGSGEPAPEKYMNYIMERTDTGYRIVKLKDPVNIAASNIEPPEELRQLPAEEPAAPQ